MIKPLLFIDTAVVSALYTVKYKERAQAGVLMLRDAGEDGEAADLPILKEWKGARALLTRMKSAAAPFLNGQTPVLGKVWIETLPPQSGTMWNLWDDEYHQAHIRTRTCLIFAPNAYTLSGEQSAQLGVGVLNVVEHRLLHCEVNHSLFARTHLVVDVRRPDAVD